MTADAGISCCRHKLLFLRYRLRSFKVEADILDLHGMTIII
jgi:hypothetical protein